MPNVHLEADPKGPTPEEIIADTKDGVLIIGAGSYSIDQQRYNGQFGGGAFWEIKNGKKTRAVTNVTYNAITTDFWGSLDAVSGPSSWQQFGVGGDVGDPADIAGLHQHHGLGLRMCPQCFGDPADRHAGGQAGLGVDIGPDPYRHQAGEHQPEEQRLVDRSRDDDLFARLGQR